MVSGLDSVGETEIDIIIGKTGKKSKVSLIIFIINEEMKNG